MNLMDELVRDHHAKILPETIKMQKYLILIAVAVLDSLLVLGQICDESSPITKTKSGDVRGTVFKSRKGKAFAAFRGIPYAQPPVGDLRFKPPKEIDKWKGVRNATEDAPICIQQDFLFHKDPQIEGSEDCLYLNVYTPKDFLNYDDEAPGNWAFKDQVAALKWVHNNIHYFGQQQDAPYNWRKLLGDAKSIIIIPTIKGLFQSAITLSGSALALWAKPMSRELFVVTNVTAQTVGCSFPDTKSMVECLRKIPARDLVNAVNVFRQFIKSEPLTPYFPAIEEKSAGNPEPFITEQPVDIIKKGISITFPFVRQEDVRLKINKDFDKLKDMLAIRLSVEPGLIDSFWTDVKEFYFKGKDNLNDTKAITGLTNVYGDRAFIYPTYQSMQLHKQMGHKHIFAYNFNYRGKYSYGDLFAGTNNNLLNYKWGFPIATISFTPCSLQEDLRITNFPGPIWMLIRFRSIYLIRDPTPEHLYQDRQRWEELPHTDSLLTEEELHFMEISGGFEEGAYSLNLTNGFYTDRMRFWATKPLAENRVFNGFFTTYDDEAPGNWAFKDQVAALKWVHNNIHYFGGSNKKITIAGQSAGAGPVHHLLLSPTTKGLFQSAITLSGSALALWAKPMSRELFVVTNVTAQTVGCSFPDTKSMVECLRKIPARDLVNAVNVFRQFIKSEPLTPYFPAIEEKSAGNPEPFITEQPVDIIKKGDFHNVPWMIGVVSNEGILRSAPFVRQEDVRLKINKDFDQLKDMLAIRLSVEPGLIDSFWTDVKEFYFKGKDNLNDTKAITGLTNVYGDRAFIYPTYQSMQLHKQMGHKHIFAYNFNYRGKYSYGDLFAGTNNNLLNYKWGVSHCDDLIYTLFSPGRFTNYELSRTDLDVSKIMIEFWINFVKYGDPTPEHLYQDRQRWEELPHTDSLLTEEELHFMEISGGFEEGAYSLNLTNGFYTDRMRFWATKPLAENRVFNGATT
ncbi:carboxylic ester hydrolase [Holotrichia oblita]|uniref:Carboxylic ester hydrolase n=1 Tax=Holotrichia oblita TaxID=644536 RepID=A0ACB9TI83_HOLOL|nr:carboxylic ester hydrolase [Holotrichia oblita]